MDGGEEDASTPVRAFEVDGEEWVVRIVGTTSVGTAPDVRAPVLLFGFARAAEPDGLEREAMAPGTSLDDLSDDDLAQLLQRSRSTGTGTGRAGA